MAKAMTATAGSPLACPPRFGTARNPDRRTLGGKVGEICARLGAPPMPHQQLILDVTHEIDDDGNLWYDEADVLFGRQGGKTRLTLAVQVARAAVFPHLFGTRQGVTYTAQDRNKARRRWEREFVPALQASKAFREVRSPRLIRRPTDFYVRRSNGSEEIQIGPSHSYLAIDTPAKSGGEQAKGATAGHGDTLDLGIIDEALAHADDTQEQAMRPTMATRRSAQLWVLGTAGFSTSFYWYRKVLAGRAAVEQGVESRVAYFEWSAPEDADPTDPATWRAAIPALGHTINERFIAAELERYLRGELIGEDDELGAGLDGFRRAYLSQWVDPPVLGAGGDRPIPVADWWARMDDESRIDPEAGPVVFSVDVSPERHTSIVAVGTRSDGAAHVELVEHRPGTEWAAARIAQLVARHRPVDRAVTLQGSAPAYSLVPALEQLGVEANVLTAQECVAACGLLFDEVTHPGFLWHIGVPETANAFDAARRVKVGDGWKWSRVQANGNIAPAVAISYALWTYRKHRPMVAPATSKAPQTGPGYDVFDRRGGRLKL